MIKIAFIEQEYQNNPERVAFQTQVRNLEIPFFHAWENLATNIPDILFYHGGNEEYLRPRPYNTWRMELENVLLIEFGADPTQKKQKRNNIVSYIKYSDLSARLPAIKDQINQLTDVTKEKVEDIIFGIDPEIEGYLQKLSTVLPFSDAWDKELRDTKHKLNNKVTELIQ